MLNLHELLMLTLIRYVEDVVRHFNCLQRQSITVRWGFKALTFHPDVKPDKSNDLASWNTAPLAVIQCCRQCFNQSFKWKQI